MRKILIFIFILFLYNRNSGVMSGIDDIQHLKKNSVKDSTVVFVDSSTRNKFTYPNPNEYKITFDTPIKFVYGIEILDAAIPRTMYQIDQYNDTIYFYTSAGGEEAITIDHQDYSLDLLVDTINKKFDDSSTLTALTAYTLNISSNDTNKVFISNGATGTADADYFYILAFKSNMAETLGFDLHAVSSSTDYTTFTASDSQYSTIANATNLASYDSATIIARTFKSGIGKGDHSKDGSYAIDSTFATKQNMQTPGIVNLIGDRFIRLRSDTIEAHLQSPAGRSSNNVGIGLIKLGVSGYSDIRMDFINVKMKEFHPIGKLSSIDFKFETIDNNLYDFKGVNHHFLLVVKYYVPQPSAKTIENCENYVLNPNYNPDLIEYEKTQYEKHNIDDMTKEMDEKALNFRKNYLEAEKKYLYESDEELEPVRLLGEKDSEEEDSEEEDSDEEEDSEEEDSDEEDIGATIREGANQRIPIRQNAYLRDIQQQPNRYNIDGTFSQYYYHGK